MGLGERSIHHSVQVHLISEVSHCGEVHSNGKVSYSVEVLDVDEVHPSEQDYHLRGSLSR